MMSTNPHENPFLNLVSKTRVSLWPASGVIEVLEFESTSLLTPSELIAVLLTHPAYRNSYIDPPGREAEEPWHGPFDLTRLRPDHYHAATKKVATGRLDGVLQAAAENGASEAAIKEAGETIDAFLRCDGALYLLEWMPGMAEHKFSHVLAGEWLELACVAGSRLVVLISFFD